jgi:pilus assembly protein FimV
VSAPSPLGAEQKREVSVEELIDLEQQAEFFVVLGQDEAAIDLLMGHLRGTSGASPLPYLKLLEIYKRRGERKPYEQLRERFNSRFSALAPDWEVDLQGGRSLEDYPSVLDKLQILWGQPQRSMDVLQATLLRSSDDDASESFDLPAYRELMLLYAVARDRSDADVGGTVDLLLPIGEVAGPGYSGVLERLVATTSLDAQPSVHKPLTVDVPLDAEDDAATRGFMPTNIDPASTSRKV